MDELNEIDHQIFVGNGSDTPHNAADGVYTWFADQIDGFDYFDRACLMALEAQVAMLWRLSSYFHNVVISRERAIRWRQSALEFFDRETAARGDAAKVADWRSNIARNFDRLIDVLLPEDPKQ